MSFCNAKSLAILDLNNARPQQYTAKKGMEFVLNCDGDEMTTMWPHFFCVPCFIVSLLCIVSTLCIVSIYFYVYNQSAYM